VYEPDVYFKGEVLMVHSVVASVVYDHRSHGVGWDGTYFVQISHVPEFFGFCGSVPFEGLCDCKDDILFFF